MGKALRNCWRDQSHIIGEKKRNKKRKMTQTQPRQTRISQLRQRRMERIHSPQILILNKQKKKKKKMNKKQNKNMKRNKMTTQIKRTYNDILIHFFFFELILNEMK